MLRKRSRDTVGRKRSLSNLQCCRRQAIHVQKNSSLQVLQAGYVLKKIENAFQVNYKLT